MDSTYSRPRERQLVSDQCDPKIKSYIKDRIEKLSKELNNTPKVCKSSYIHPLLLQNNIDEKIKKIKYPYSSKHKYLFPVEEILLRLLKNNGS